MLNLDLSKLTIWLTGASRGIGKAVAERLVSTNANLILSASTKESFQNMVNEFSNFSNVLFFPFEISNYDEIRKIYSRIISLFGKVDILINNAGIGIFKELIEITPEDFDKTMSVNFKGSYFCIQSVLPEMIKNQFGMIINISSIAAISNFPAGTIYGASKAALSSMSNSLREEVRQFGIKVIDILPGATETEIWDKDSLENYSHRMMKPEDIAEVVLSAIYLNLNPRLMTEQIIVKPQLGNI
ncbi:MAG: SDR family oxidoreductase [Candidatus Kapabacteria bacterium]|nr:SDR family oxidoreductase [Candidatus Kapabacteria bacterium]